MTTTTVRLRGTFGDPNHFAIYLVFVLFTSVALAVVAGRRRRWPETATLIAFAVASFCTLLGTYSRTGYLALLVATASAIGIYVAAQGLPLPIPRRQSILFAGGTLIVLTGLLFLAGLRLLERVDPRSEVNDWTDRVHAQTMEAAFDHFIDQPAFGIGVGDLPSELGQGAREWGAHSSYLAVAAELGAVGLLLMLLAGVTAARLLAGLVLRSARSSDGALAIGIFGAFMGFLAANVVYDLWWDDFNWVILGAIVAGTGTVVSASPLPSDSAGPVSQRGTPSPVSARTAGPAST